MTSAQQESRIASKFSGLHLPLGSADPMALLEQFLYQLQREEDLDEQLSLILETVKEATGAELVYVCSLRPGRGAQMLGETPLTEDWARNLTMEIVLLSDEGQGEIVYSPDTAISTRPTPESAILIQLSRSKKVWLTAATLTQGQKLTENHLKIMRLARRMLLQQHENTRNCTSLQETLFGLVRCLSASLDARDPYTWGHSERVARISGRIGRELGLTEQERNDLYLGGLLHDIGKIGVPDVVLRKPIDLTEEERHLIEQHPVIGDEILIHVKQLAHIRPAVRNHHERYDGNGYPDGLQGENIPLCARIMAVADACDAMMSDRPYRKGKTIEQVESTLRKGAGTQWDRLVVQAFFKCRDGVFNIYQSTTGDSISQAVEKSIMFASNPKEANASAYSAHMV